MKEHIFCGKTSGECSIELSRRNNIDAHTLFGRDFINTAKAERFTGVKGTGILAKTRLHRENIGAGIGTYAVLVEYVKRGSVFLCEKNGIYACYGQMAFFIYRQVGVQHGKHLLSG